MTDWAFARTEGAFIGPGTGASNFNVSGFGVGHFTGCLSGGGEGQVLGMGRLGLRVQVAALASAAEVGVLVRVEDDWLLVGGVADCDALDLYASWILHIIFIGLGLTQHPYTFVHCQIIPITP